MFLLDLPQELLDHIPGHLRNIEDFLALSSTCRLLRRTCSLVSSNTILRLAAAQSSTFFRPDPHYLIAATCSQLSKNAIESAEARQALRHALQGGVEGLLEHCIENCGLTLAEIRRLHEMRFTIFNPLANWIDQLAGKQWYQTPGFWSGGVSDAYTIFAEPERALYQFAIYGELLGSSSENYIRGQKDAVLDREVRLDYVKYCVPDSVCAGGYRGFEVLNTGPYKSGETDTQVADQAAMWHILKSTRWNRAWAEVRAAAGGDFEEDSWKQEVWNACVLNQGLGGLSMLRPGGLTQEWVDKLHEIRRLIEGLEGSDRPSRVEVPLVHPYLTTDFAILYEEALACMQNMWPGTYAADSQA
ncbi:hypothetical protein LTS18_012468 [Coniosporium uncinatum]|uniref:Uncharacterized protein n=1 Tax=Coniosporium uncinatum TaxID=93489 RepID=A0ACC3DJA7_9PEZI|nr:hypothetical protein LTS18_012468 [Coniosporium uncinatum]